MKMKLLYITIGCFLFVSNTAQNLDTITKNYEKPAVLDILSDRMNVSSQSRVKETPNRVQPTTAKRKNNIRRKVITEKASQEKATIIRAISQFAPRDQFNVSAFKELTYEISDYTSQNISLPGVLGERVQNGEGTVELISIKTLVRLEIDTAGIEGDIDFFERLVYNSLDLNLSKDEVSVKIWEFPYSAVRKAKATNTIPAILSEPVYDDLGEEKLNVLSEWWFWLIMALLFIGAIILVLFIKSRKKNCRGGFTY